MRYPRSKTPPKPDIHRLGAQAASLPPRLEALLGLWLRKCAGRAMPAHDDIRGEELRPWLSQLALIDAGADQRFHLRQCGLHLIRRLGREATGYGVHELAPDIGAHLDAILKATCRVAAPVVAVSYVQLGRAFNSYTDVALPLAGAGGGIATVLLGSHPIREG